MSRHAGGRSRRERTSRPARPVRCRADDLLMNAVTRVSIPTRPTNSESAPLSLSRQKRKRKEERTNCREVLLLLRHPRINDIFHSRDSNRSLSDISRKDDFARVGRGEIERLLLLQRGETGVKGADEDLREKEEWDQRDVGERGRKRRRRTFAREGYDFWRSKRNDFTDAATVSMSSWPGSRGVSEARISNGISGRERKR